MPETEPSTAPANTSEGAELSANQSSGELGGETTPAQEAPSANPQLSADAGPGSLPSHTRSANQSTNPAANPAPATNAPKPSAGAPAPGTQAPLDYEKQYRALLPEYTRLTQAMKAFQGMGAPDQVKQQLSQLQQMQAESKKLADAQKLMPWNPRHPDHQTTSTALQRVKAYQAAARGIPANLPPEQRSEIARSIAGELGVTEQDAQTYKRWSDHQSQVQERLAQDPEGFIHDTARQIAMQVVQEYEQFVGVRDQTRDFLSQNQDLVKDHAKEIDWAMNHPARREVGIEFARLKAENEALKAKHGQALENQETAEAQKAHTRQRNTLSRRDQATSPIQSDPVSEAEKQGLSEAGLADFLIRKRRQAANT